MWDSQDIGYALYLLIQMVPAVMGVTTHTVLVGWAVDGLGGRLLSMTTSGSVRLCNSYCHGYNMHMFNTQLLFQSGTC